MKKIQHLPEIVKTLLQKSLLKHLKSLKLRKNGVYGKERKTLLHLCCQYSSLKLVKYCINKLNQSASKLTLHNFSSLHYSSFSGSLKITKFILRHCEELKDLQNNKGETALILSAKTSHFSVCKFLIRKGASLDLQDKKGWTVGHWAAYHGNLEVLQMLKARNFDFSLRNLKNENVLHFAAWNGNIECFEFLLQMVSIHQESVKGSVVEYCKGNWKLLEWIFQKKIVKAKVFEKVLFKIQAPLNVFQVAKIQIRVNDVILNDREELLE
jgi:ankyrin repeat protein